MGGAGIVVSRWPIEPYRLVGFDFGDPWFAGSGKIHTGEDVAAHPGQAVYAMADGVVHNHVVDPKWGYGVILDHGGWGATYWHVDHFLPDGGRVWGDQKVATVYDLGPKDTHLHNSIWIGKYDGNLDRGALPPSSWPDRFVDPTDFIRAHYQPPAPPTLEDDMPSFIGPLPLRVAKGGKEGVTRVCSGSTNYHGGFEYRLYPWRDSYESSADETPVEVFVTGPGVQGGLQHRLIPVHASRHEGYLLNTWGIDGEFTCVIHNPHGLDTPISVEIEVSKVA